MNEKEIIGSKLKVLKNEILENLIDEIAQYIQYTEDAEIFLKNPQDLSIQQKIGLYLIAKHYGKKEGTFDEDFATNKELSEKLRVPIKSISSRVSELKSSGYIVTKSRGKHIFFIPKIEEFINKIKKW